MEPVPTWVIITVIVCVVVATIGIGLMGAGLTIGHYLFIAACLGTGLVGVIVSLFVPKQQPSTSSMEDH